MICQHCGEKVWHAHAHVKQGSTGTNCYFCSPKAERSGVPQGCPSSANGSASAAEPLSAPQENKTGNQPAESQDVKAGDETVADSSVVQLPASDPSGHAPLLACPFCGYTGRYIALFVDDHALRVSIKCSRCDSYGPNMNNEAEAIAAWNKRAGVNAPTPDGDTPQRVSSGGS